MKSVEYVVTQTDPKLIAEAFQALNRLALDANAVIIVHRGEEANNVLRLMALMRMGIKCGDHITVTVECDEAEDRVARLVELWLELCL